MAGSRLRIVGRSASGDEASKLGDSGLQLIPSLCGVDPLVHVDDVDARRDIAAEIATAGVANVVEAVPVEHLQAPLRLGQL